MNITTEQLKARLAKLVATDPQEIGGRVADVRPLIEEIIALRAQQAEDAQAHKAEVARITRNVFKRQWVNCPMCGETDMAKEWFSSEDDGPYIKCVNLNCASNGGTNCDAWMKRQFQGKNPIAYETAVLLTKAVEAQCEATAKAEQERDALARQVEELTKDKVMLDTVEAECWDVRCQDVPSYGDDADICWVVIEHHMAQPREREVGNGGPTAREAITSAMKGETHE